MSHKAVIFDMYETLITFYRSPLYFSENIAADCGLSRAEFKSFWDKTEDDRTLGIVTFEEVIEDILRSTGRYSDELLKLISEKRQRSKYEAFKTIDPEVKELLKVLKDRRVKIALITNCFHEERTAIRNSDIFKCFDAACLSCELGVMKPDEKIFKECLKRLNLKPEECLYVGDGGSSELEAASALGMKAIQATWYFKDNTRDHVHLKKDFATLLRPMDVIRFL